jgi:DNA-binding response OmpR family regulator
MSPAALFVDAQNRPYPFIEEFLASRGIRFRLVTSAEQALLAMGQSIPEIVFADLNLPDRDGPGWN